jgi:hypothetical protein
MKKDTGIKFYHIFKVGPYIGVHTANSTDVIIGYLLGFILMLLVGIVLSNLMPIFFSLFFLFLLVTDIMVDRLVDPDLKNIHKTKLNYESLNNLAIFSVLIILSTIGTVLDAYHGWVGWKFITMLLGKKVYATLITINILLAAFHMYMFFLPIKSLPLSTEYLIVFIAILIFGFIMSPITNSLIIKDNSHFESSVLEAFIELFKPL